MRDDDRWQGRGFSPVLTWSIYGFPLAIHLLSASQPSYPLAFAR